MSQFNSNRCEVVVVDVSIAKFFCNRKLAELSRQSNVEFPPSNKLVIRARYDGTKRRGREGVTPGGFDARDEPR